jgi:hypothetical protein
MGALAQGLNVSIFFPLTAVSKLLQKPYVLIWNLRHQAVDKLFTCYFCG